MAKKTNTVSNSSLVALVAIALVITVVGTTVSLVKLSNLGVSSSVLSGAATAGGTSSVTLAGTVGLDFAYNNNTIDFGSGYVNSLGGYTVAYLDSEDDAFGPVDGETLHSNSWYGWVPTGTGVNGTNRSTIILNNTGTVPLIVNISANASNISAWLCGGVCSGGSITGRLEIKMETSINDPCSGTEGAPAYGHSNPGQTSGDVDLLNHTGNYTIQLCDNWDTGMNSTGHILFNLSVPSDAASGTQTLNIFFTATDATG